MTTQAIKYGRVTWTNIVRPTQEDIEALGEAYPHFHPLDLEDTLSRIERPKIDEYDDYLFVVMHFPLWDPVHRVSRPSEVDMFIGSGYLVTVHDGVLKPLNELFQHCLEDEDVRRELMSHGASRVFYAVIDRLVDYIFPILYKVDANIRAIEEDIFTESTRHVMQAISFVRRDVIALRRIIRPQIPIVSNLERVDRPFIHEELEEYFGDILDHLYRARDILDDHAEVIAGLAETADTMASYHINEVMRILTVFSVIMMPLELIAGCYGMNVLLPFEDHPVAFAALMALMGLTVIVMLIFFKSQRWL